jgi:hypothetical protein
VPPAFVLDAEQEAEFREQWAALVPITEMAAYFDITESQVGRLRASLRLPGRTQADRNRIMKAKRDRLEAKLQARADSERVVCGCDRCGWLSGLVTLAVGREQFQKHRCRAAAA